MILDHLSHASAYHALSPRFRQAFHWLATTDLASLAPGKIDIDADHLFALPQQVATRPVDQCRWEAHRTYADVQVLVRGTERMACAPLAQFREQTPYDPAKDVAFYTTAFPHVTTATVPAGWFAVFLPHDVHMPLIQLGAPEPVFKVVLKVRV